MSDGSFEIHGTLTRADMTRFSYFHTFRLIWPVALLFVAVLPLNVLFFLQGGKFLPLAQNLFPLSFLVLLWAVLPLISARRQFVTRPYLAEAVTYSFNAAGVQLTALSFSSSMNWAIFRAIRETKNAFLFYSASNIAHVVPKHFFSSEGEIAAWRAAVTAWMAPKSIEVPGIVGKLC